MSQVKAIPEGFRTLTPHMVIRHAGEAIEFYKRAFGAEEMARMPGPDGKTVMHAELKIGDSMVMLCDEFPGAGGCAAPDSLKGTTVTLHLYVEDADAMFQRAVAAGAKVAMPVMDTFWGDRYGKLTDPFGHQWGVATHKRDLTPEQIQKNAAEFFSKMGKKGP
jgi:PhnB protein